MKSPHSLHVVGPQEASPITAEQFHIHCQRDSHGAGLRVRVQIDGTLPSGTLVNVEWHDAQDKTLVRQLYTQPAQHHNIFHTLLPPGKFYLSAGLFTSDWSECLLWLPEIQFIRMPPKDLPLSQAQLLTAAQASYRQFLKNCAQTVSPDQIRICRPENGGDTVSEGVAYGMLLSLAHNDPATFQMLWNYAQTILNDHGLMAWHIHPGGQIADSGSASDADQDMAFALLQASSRWNNESFHHAGMRTLYAMREWDAEGAHMKPGDGWNGADVINPSYFCPGYYPVFERAIGDGWWLHWQTWSLQWLRNHQHSESGLWPDWASDTGQSLPPPGDIFSYDAIRIPWRLYTATRAGMGDSVLELMERTAWFFQSQGLRTLRNAYTLSGNPLSQQLSGAFVAGSAIAQQFFPDHPTTQELVADLAQWMPETYYDAAIQALGLASIAGLFPPG